MRAKKIDANQTEIVKRLRSSGVSVCLLSAVGEGVPDLLAGYCGVNVLLEIKNPKQKKSDRALTKDEKLWHETWRGAVYIIETYEEAMSVILFTAGLPNVR